MTEFSMYGAVPLRTIKKALLDLKNEGRLDRVKMVDLTNCTFDGHIYNTRRVMEECLGDKAGPHFPLGRSLVRLRALVAVPKTQDRDGGGRGHRRLDRKPGRGCSVREKPLGSRREPLRSTVCSTPALSRIRG